MEERGKSLAKHYKSIGCREFVRDAFFQCLLIIINKGIMVLTFDCQLMQKALFVSKNNKKKTAQETSKK